MLRVSVIATILIAILMSSFALLVISYAGARDVGADANVFHYFKMQFCFAIAAFILAFIIARLDYHIYKQTNLFWILTVGTLLSLLLVLCPGIGVAVKGSQRWIGLGPLRVQPVEFVKVAVVVILSAHMDRLGGIVNRLSMRTIFLPLILIGGTITCLVFQPDFGGAMVVCFLAGLMLLLGGLGWWKCALLGILGLCIIVVLLLSNENRLKRLQNEGEGENYQAAQSEIAFRNGGLMGLGIGQGMQRQGYLPECHTDFIFSIIGEDYGLVGSFTVVILFLALLYFGVAIAFYAPDKQGMLLAFGATMVLCAQGAANMAVVTHIFPTKGLALPFFSYGGSSLLASASCIGLLISVGRKAITAQENPIDYKNSIHSL